MFQELMPLLAQRIFLLTVSRVSDEQISVNIIPKPLKPEQQEDRAALTTPRALLALPKNLTNNYRDNQVEFVETPGAVLDLEECERANGGRSQRSQRSSQEINELETLQCV